MTELVPVQGHPHVQLEYKKLRTYEDNRRELITEVIDGAVVDLEVKELLDGVDLPGMRSGTQMWEQGGESLSVVVSYAQADEVWTTQLITAGQQWESELFASLDRARIIVFLLSTDVTVHGSDFLICEKTLRWLTHRPMRVNRKVVLISPLARD